MSVGAISKRLQILPLTSLADKILDIPITFWPSCGYICLIMTTDVLPFRTRITTHHGRSIVLRSPQLRGGDEEGIKKTDLIDTMFEAYFAIQLPIFSRGSGTITSDSIRGSSGELTTMDTMR
jgi:hypothetical protein